MPINSREWRSRFAISGISASATEGNSEKHAQDLYRIRSIERGRIMAMTVSTPCGNKAV